MARRLALIGILVTALGVVFVGDGYAPAARPSASPIGPVLSAWLAGVYRPASCATTPQQTWYWSFKYGARTYLGPPMTVVVGGRLATYPTRNLSASNTWFIAAEPRPSIRLRATRLDRDVPPIDFEAVGRSFVTELPGDFDRSWLYINSVETADVFPTPAGCWNVRWLDGDNTDAVVLSLAGPSGSR